MKYLSKNKKKIITLIPLSLIIIIIILIFITSCQKTENINDNNDGRIRIDENANIDANGPDVPEYAVDYVSGERSMIPDGIEDEDMDGMDVRICVRSNWYKEELFIEEETGDPVEDAIYLRNKKIEERFNVNLNMVLADTPAQTGLKNAQAGLSDYELIADHMLAMGSASLQKPFFNWLEIPTIDLSKPWFPSDILREMTVNNLLYVLAGDYCHTHVYLTICMFFNKKLVQDYAIEDPYKMTLDGKWTLDKLSEITKDLYNDLNGSGTADMDDFYGFTSNYHGSVIAYEYSSGMRIMNKTANSIEYALPNEKTYANFQKIYDLFNQRGTYAGTWELSEDLFQRNQAVFMNLYLSFAKTLRDSENDFGIIPYPKFDEAQEKYHTVVNAAATLLAIPITAREPDKIGKIVNALNAESWKTVVPQYYDIGMKVKFARDDESVKTMDMLLDGRVYDLARVYDDNDNGYVYYLQALMSKNNSDIASWFDKQQGKAEKHIATINKVFFEP